MATTKYSKGLLQKVNTKTAVGIDFIPPKLVKLAAQPLSQTGTEAIDMCIKQNNFPNNAKVASVFSLDKGKSNKYISNFRPVSLLNTFSKIYEQAIKEQNYIRHLKFRHKENRIVPNTLLLSLSKTGRENLIKIFQWVLS